MTDKEVWKQCQDDNGGSCDGCDYQLTDSCYLMRLDVKEYYESVGD